MRLRHAAALAALLCIGATTVAQDATAPTGHRHKLRHVPGLPHPQPNGNAPALGQLLLGLSAAQLDAFAAGREEFESVETVAGGLGPIFNNNSCAACHAVPLSGGAGVLTVTRFGRTEHGHFDPLAEQGGSLLQQFRHRSDAAGNRSGQCQCRRPALDHAAVRRRPG